MEKKRSIYFGQDFQLPPPAETILLQSSLISNSFTDIAFTNLEHPKKLDLYLPTAGKAPYPVIIWFHGGGWYIGDKQDGIALLAGPFLAKGYAVVSANYRMSWREPFPAQIHDAKAAVRWVRANAAKYNLNQNKIIAAGASAGGHLAALLGTSYGVSELEDPSLGNGECSSRVDGVIEWYAPVNFLSIDAQHLSLCQDPYHNHEDSPESHLLGDKPREIPDKARAASPLTYVRADAPPFYIIHGKADVAVPYLQSVELADALGKIAGRYKIVLELVEKANHLDDSLMNSDVMNRIMSFFAMF